MKRLLFALLLALLALSIVAQQEEHQQNGIVSEHPPQYTPSHSIRKNIVLARGVKATLANDGGSSLNNGTVDNGKWDAYGIGDQVGVNSRSDKTYTYSLNWEKTVLLLTNWARMSPTGFKTRFLNLFAAGKSLETTGLPPLFEHFNLAEAARYHSYDMSANNCFSHPSCNGEATFVRVKSFYNMEVAMAENIAAGQVSPLAVTMGWINSDGHRANILGASYTIIGIGYYPKIGAATYPHYWTQNFAGGSHGISNPIVAASHIFFDASTITFLANYYHTSDLQKSKAPLSVSVFVDDVEYAMSIPTSSRYTDTSVLAGTFEYNTTRVTGGSACRKYYVRAIDSAGFKYFYPSVGYLLTQGENSNCVTGYLRAARPGENPTCTALNNCNGNGDCVSTNVCSCNAGYKGSTDCKTVSCENVGNCNTKGTCTGPNVCTCISGWKGTGCAVASCDSLNNCNGNGTCTSPNTCTCKTGYSGSSCNAFDCSSLSNCNGNGQCIGPNTCSCNAGYKGSSDCKTASCEAFNNCNGNGQCSAPNVCTCKSGYQGADCKANSCEAVSFCSGKGSCTGPNTCTCNANVYGSRCDLTLDATISSLYTTSQSIFYVPSTVDTVFRSSVASTTTFSSMVYKWTQISGPTISNLDNVSVAGTDKKDLGIKAGSLTEGSAYTFRLNVTRVQSTGTSYASKDVKVTVNRSPQITSFKIVNATNSLEVSTGIALRSLFKSSLVATDPDGQVMTYSFGYYTPENKKVHIVELSSSSTSPSFSLPYYSGGQITVFFVVRDSAFGFSEKTKILSLQDPTLVMTAQEISTLVKTLVNTTSLTVLETATSLLSSGKLSTTEKTTIRSEILNQVVSSSESPASKIALIERLTTQPTEITLETAQKGLKLLLSVSTALKSNLQTSDRASIIGSTSQIISSMTTSNPTITSLLKQVIDATQNSASISLVEGQSSVSTSNLVKSAIVKSTIDNFNFSPSQIGLSSLNLPKDALKQLLSSKFQYDASTNAVSVSLTVLTKAIYSHINPDLISSIVSIGVLSDNGTEFEISSLSSPIEFELDVVDLNSTMTGQCQFFNPQTSKFSSIGIESLKVSDTRIKCKTIHLTDFAISSTVAESSLRISSAPLSTSRLSISTLFIVLLFIAFFTQY